MKKQILTAALFAAGLTGISSAQAALIDIGVAQTAFTIGNTSGSPLQVWTGNTIKQQDKLFSLDTVGYTDLDPATIVTFNFSQGVGGADQHGISWKPVNPGLPASYVLAYQVDVTPEAAAAGARFTLVSVGVDTAGSCNPTANPPFVDNNNTCSQATKGIFTDSSLGTEIATIKAGQNLTGSTTAVNGLISLFIYETVSWENSQLNAVSNIFVENQGVPEPDSIALLGIGLAGMFFGRRAMKK